MLRSRLWSVSLFIFILSTISCVSEGPHLSLNPDVGPVNPTGNIQMMGSGAAVSRSDNFVSYGSVTYVAGKTIEGDVFQMESPEFEIGRQGLENAE